MSSYAERHFPPNTASSPMLADLRMGLSVGHHIRTVTMSIMQRHHAQLRQPSPVTSLVASILRRV